MTQGTDNHKIIPVILCGGAGSRLWPMSRPEKPKQFHTLVNEYSLLANTISRMPRGDVGAIDFAQPIILGNQSLEREFRAEMNAGDIDPQIIILEPVIRDTAPAIAAVTAHIYAEHPDAFVLVVPSDARIDDHEAFKNSVMAAAELAADGTRIMTLGITPTRPDTQYGYIERGETIGRGYVVEKFHEKPDELTAQAYVESGRYLWNAGMFLYRADLMASTFEALQPTMWRYAGHAVRRATKNDVFMRLEPNAFSACDQLSMDYAIMENAGAIGVVEAKFDWDDLGSWSQLYEQAAKDDNANAISGHGIVVDATGNYIRARGTIVAIAGLDGITVVAEDGKVLVVPTDKAHLVKSVTGAFKKLQGLRPGLSGGDNTVIRNWLFDAALPFWAAHGLDHKNGGVHEALRFDGTPALNATKRLRVLGRQIYCFAHAKKMGWKGDALTPVRHCFDQLVSHGWHADGGWIHRFNRDGSVADDTRDTYDQCFTLLAFAWMMRAGIDVEEARVQFDRTMAYINENLMCPSGTGLLEGVGQSISPHRRANPHMHFLEAMLAAYEATNDVAFLNHGENIVALFESHFYDSDMATVTEFFNDDWSRVNEKGTYTRVEPGHHYEWVWLLLRYLEHRDRPGLFRKAAMLFATARAFGHHHRTGAAADTMQPDGRDMAVTARCWPQTEALKAAIAFEKAGLSVAADFKLSMLEILFEHYLDGPVIGGWYDRIDETGRMCAPDMPSSTFYHIYCALADYLGE